MAPMIAQILPKDDPKTRFIHKPIPTGLLDQYIRELLPLGGYAP